MELSRSEKEAKSGRAAARSALRIAAAWLRAGGTWERPHTAILRGIDDRLGDLTNFLGSRHFFYADEPSMADLAVHAMLVTMRNDSIEGHRAVCWHAAAVAAGTYMDRVEQATGG